MTRGMVSEHLLVTVSEKAFKTSELSAALDGVGISVIAQQQAHLRSCLIARR
jgi:hypothetical protein